MTKTVEYALAVIDRAASGNFILTYSEMRNAHATLAARIAEQDAEIARMQAQQVAVWQYLQSVSPWSESNDMDWADEIICGIDGLRITDAEAVAWLSADGELVSAAEKNRDKLDWYTVPLYTHPQPSAAVTKANRGEDDCVMSGCPERIGMISHHSATDHYVFSINGEVYALERGEFEGMVLLLCTLNRADAERLAVTKKFSQYTHPQPSAAVTMPQERPKSLERIISERGYAEIYAALSQGGKP